MQQDEMNRQTGTLNVTFQQKSTGLSLVIVLSAMLYYVVNMWPMRSTALATSTLPAGYGSLVLTTVALIVVAQIVLVTVLAIGAGSAAPPTEHEKMADLRAKRNAYFILVAGLMAAVVTVFLQELTPFCTANVAILAFAAAEIVRLASQLFYGRP
ncbi:MAG: hypothetical protein H6647_20745 [Anaerolineales bacterium]|nr:hypothetical protein [Anaerolineales bacterium]